MMSIRDLIEWIVVVIEMFAVLVIIGAVLLALIPHGMLRSRVGVDVVSGYKQRMGKGLLLGLELLLAADIIGTVGLQPTIEGLFALGLLALIRSFLSWSLEVEIEGRWPWQTRASRQESAGVETAAAAELSRRGEV
jgi:uncharacterized membrane protein